MSRSPALPEVSPADWPWGGTSIILSYAANQLESHWPEIIEMTKQKGAIGWSKLWQGQHVHVTLYLPAKTEQ